MAVEDLQEVRNAALASAQTEEQETANEAYIFGLRQLGTPEALEQAE